VWKRRCGSGLSLTYVLCTVNTQGVAKGRGRGWGWGSGRGRDGGRGGGKKQGQVQAQDLDAVLAGGQTLRGKGGGVED